jgi:hypothetical protein
MKRVAIFGLMFFLIAMQFACNLPIPQEDLATPSIEVNLATQTATLAAATDLPATTASPVPSRLTEAMLRNFTYTIPDFNVQAALQDGEFQNADLVVRWVGPAAFGDLNGDGQADAAVVLSADPSGSGTFYYLFTVLNQDGAPVQSGSASIGDRQGILHLEIAGGRAILDYVTQGINDPSCCPSEHRIRAYRLEGGVLRLASEQIVASVEANATPLAVEILIDQPVEGDPLISPITVRGRINPVPPEGKLAYAVTDQSGVLLDQGEVSLEGTPGGPGALAFEISLSPDTPGLIFIEVIDAAGGFLRGRSTVWLVKQP